jgi:hypothetical protein
MKSTAFNKVICKPYLFIHFVIIIFIFYSNGIIHASVTDLSSWKMLQPTSTAPSWTYNITGNNHTIYLPSSAYMGAANNTLSSGDYIGVFYDSAGILKCGGYIKWLGSTTAISAWGASSGNTNGFQNNEVIKWKIWRLASNQEYLVQAAYSTDDCYFPNSGNYITNGLSGIIALSDNTPVTLTISGLNSSYCLNSQPVNLTGSPSGGMFSGAGVTGTQFNPATAGTGTHHLNYTYTDSYGHTYTQSKCVGVNTIPLPALGPDIYICSGLSSVLNSGSFQSYLWSTGATTQTITVGAAGNYSVSVTNSGGCSNSDTLHVYIYTPQQVNLGNDVTLCEGLTATLNAGSFITYLWNNNATTQTIGVTVNGAYSVTITDTNGCTTSDVVNVTFTTAPVSSFTAPPAVYINSVVEVHYSGSSSAGAFYSWSFGDATVSSGSGQGPYYIQWSTTGTKIISLQVTENGCTSLITQNTVSVIQNLNFTEISTGMNGLTSSAAAWCDLDNDNDPDLIITGNSSSVPTSTIYRNDGNNVFTGITAVFTGVSGGTVSTNDFDMDNDVDILITGNGSNGYISNLYRNDGNLVFTLVATGIPGVWHGAAVWTDYDNDGDQDLLITGTTATGNISKLFRNNGNSTFTEIPANLTALSNSTASWGDYDNDGDPDILIAGTDNGSNPVSLIYRNDNGVFVNISAGLTGITNGSAAWGDFDSDGDLDIVITGTTGLNPVSKIYRNDNSNFTDINAGLTGLSYSSANWGDFDSDGDPDILLTGINSSVCYSKIYKNNNGIFTEFFAALSGVSGGTGLFCDYDNDGDLDVLLTGDSGSGGVTRLMRNNGPIANSVPLAPTGTTYQTGGSIITLCWNKAIDNQTPQNGLTYNVRIGISSGGSGIKSPLSNVTSGYLKTLSMGNCQLKNTCQIKNLPYGQIYWSVQAVDNNFAGSAFSSESVFTYLPTSGFSAPASICQATDATITYTGNASSSASYNWNFGGGTINSGSGQGPYLVSWSTSGTKIISLVVTENGYSSTTTTASVTVSAASAGGSVSGSSSKCIGSTTGNLTLTGFTGTINKWQKRVNSGTWSNISNTSNVYLEIPSSSGTWEYRAEVQNGTCSVAYSSSATVIVFPLSVGGNTSGGGTICLGSSTGTMTISGCTGTVNRWQKRINYGSWTNISNPSLTYSEIPSSTGTWQYRGEIQSGVCSIAYSNPVTVIVNTGSAGGTVSGGGNIICLGNSTGTLTLSGYTGNINKWQKRWNSGTWTDITNTNNYYSDVPASVGTWDYRAEVQNGTCSAAYSSYATVYVIPLSAGGSITGGSTICIGTSTGTLTLTGYTGNVNKWQKRLNSGSWTDIQNTLPYFSETPLTAGTWDYRAEVQNSTCSPAYSSLVSVIVDPVTVGGSISGGSSICLGNSTGILTLSGFTGTIIRWQKRLNSGSWTDIQNTLSYFSETPLSAGTWNYRAEVQNGSCDIAYSSQTTVIVNPLPQLNLTDTISIFEGDTALPDAGEGFQSYLWQDGQTTQIIEIIQTGTWTVTVTDTQGCQATAQIVVEVIPLFIQNIDLISGWSLISTYINPVNPLVSEVFYPVVSFLRLLKDEYGQVYWPEYGVDMVGNLIIGKGYQVMMLSFQVLQITGAAVSPENTPLTLNQGWGLIGYLRQSPASVITIMSNITQLILMKDGYGQVYWPQYQINLIGNMNPGKGYQVNMASTEILTYPSNDQNSE